MKKRKISLIIITIAMALCMVLFVFLPACSGGDKENDETEHEQSQNEDGDTGNNPGSGSESGEGPDGSGTGQSETEKKLEETTVYMVGDSTMCSFEGSDLTYYYPRYGYGTQLGNYLDEAATVENLAISGRSSKSFVTEDNYTTLTNSLSEGDYLIIGFGHNDEKDDDEARYTSPELNAVNIEGSFQKSLYDNYVSLAIEKGATPILCTPIVRASTSNNYSGTNGHIYDYGDGNGDYAECIRDLAKTYDITCIDLTTLTAELYTELGYDEAIYYHAWTTSNSASADKTHLNIYGAKEVAYLLASALAKTECPLGEYVLDGITAPTKDDLVVNENYVESSYETPDFTSSDWQSYKLGTYLNVDWYKTTFGDTGTGSPYGSSGGFTGALDSSAGKITVGQNYSTQRGKISSGSDGLSYVFTPIAATQNFKIEVTATVTMANNSSDSGATSGKQEGFGVMLRDDIYLPISDNNSSAGAVIKSNYVTAGMYNSGESAPYTTNVIFSRENTSLSSTNQKLSSEYAVGDTMKISIERVGGGQSTTCSVEYKNTTYTYTYTDFDFAATDYENAYICFCACRGTVVEFTNISLELGEIGQA